MKNRTYILFSTCFFVVYYFILLISGTDNYLFIHDNLDCEFIFRIMMNYPDNSPLMTDGIINTVQNGVPRSTLLSDLNVTSWLFGLFSPWLAYMINDILARIIGFIGITLLFNRLLNSKTPYRQKIILVCSIIFASIGSYNINCGLTFMGLPLLLWIFYNIYKYDSRWYYYIMIIAFAFWSSLPLAGIFIIASMGLWWLIDFIKTKRFNAPFFIAIIALTTAYIVVEYQMILSLFSDGFISHRTEFRFNETIHSVATQTINSIFKTQYHGGSILTLPIIALVGYDLLLNKKLPKKALTISTIIIAILLWQVVYAFLKQNVDIETLRMVQLDRFYFFLPLLWLLLAAFSIENILTSSNNKYLAKSKIFCGSMLGVIALSAVIYNTELKYNIGSLVNIKTSSPNYNEFFDTSLFDQISDHIGEPQEDYRVVSVGIHPSIAIFNGFFTLDAYQSNYPLEYKHKFRKVIEKELNKNAALKDYYDDWGSRCYVFSSELWPNYRLSKHSNTFIKNLDINTSVLKYMGCKYIFSATKIENAQEINLTLDKVFEGLYWNIYLYKLA